MDISAASKSIAKADPAMISVIKSVGKIDLPAPKSDFESLVDAIVSQQLSVKAAATIHARLVGALGNDVRPKVVLSRSPEVLRSAGLSGQKTTYLYALADAFASNPETYFSLSEQGDDEVVKTLTAIKGIGVWTAQMFLIFSLLRGDVFPVGDLGVRRAMERLFYEGEPQSHAALTQRAEVWRPHRSVASLYLWKFID